jgi:hypothetical protein
MSTLDLGCFFFFNLLYRFVINKASMPDMWNIGGQGYGMEGDELSRRSFFFFFWREDLSLWVYLIDPLPYGANLSFESTRYGIGKVTSGNTFPYIAGFPCVQPSVGCVTSHIVWECGCAYMYIRILLDITRFKAMMTMNLLELCNLACLCESSIKIDDLLGSLV